MKKESNFWAAFVVLGSLAVYAIAENFFKMNIYIFFLATGILQIIIGYAKKK